MRMLTLLFMNAVVLVCAYLAVRRFFRSAALIDQIISLVILFITQIILTELALGWIGILTLRNLVLLNLALLMVLSFFCRGGEVVLSSKKPFEGIKFNRTVWFLFSLALGFSLTKLSINLMNPPFGWDSLNYHFTFPVEWLKTANLDMPITVFDDPSPSYYPVNGSLYYLWFIFPLKNVFIADCGQALFFLLSLCAVFGIAQKTGLNKEHSLYASFLFLFIPNFFKQLEVAYVDVMVAGLFLTSLYYIFALQNDFSWQNALIYSLSTGWLLGVKTVALPYSLLLVIPFIYLCLKNINKWALGLFLPLGLILLGSFSYIRNFIDTGNPLYPLDFNLLGKNIFKGVMDMPTYRAHFTQNDYRLAKLLFDEGLGVQSLLFVLPAVFLSLPAYLVKNKGKINFILAYFFLLPLLIYLVYRYIIPLANARYLYCLLGVGLVSGIFLFSRLGVPRAVITVITLLCAFASSLECANRTELVVSIILTGIFFFTLTGVLKTVRFLSQLKKNRLFLALICVPVFLGLYLLERVYVANEYSGYVKMVKYSGFWPDAAKAWKWLNEHTQGSNIAYVGRPVPFPLYGTDFKNNVYYVSVNGTEPAKLHYFKNSKYSWGHDFLSLHKDLEAQGNYRGLADFAVWSDNLMKKKTDYLFVYSLHQTQKTIFPLEDAWAGQRQNIFQPVFSNNTIHIYKILP